MNRRIRADPGRSHHALYRSLTVDCRWSDQRAFDALNDTLRRVLLADKRTSRRRTATARTRKSFSGR